MKGCKLVKIGLTSQTNGAICSLSLGTPKSEIEGAQLTLLLKLQSTRLQMLFITNLSFNGCSMVKYKDLMVNNQNPTILYEPSQPVI